MAEYAGGEVSLVGDTVVRVDESVHEIRKGSIYRVRDVSDDGVDFEGLKDFGYESFKFKLLSRKAAAPVKPAAEASTKPSYYAITVKDVTFDVTDLIQALDLSFCLGNVLKYVVRAGKKSSNTRAEDLRKSAEYIQRELANLERLEKDKP